MLPSTEQPYSPERKRMPLPLRGNGIRLRGGAIRLRFRSKSLTVTEFVMPLLTVVAIRQAPERGRLFDPAFSPCSDATWFRVAWIFGGRSDSVGCAGVGRRWHRRPVGRRLSPAGAAGAALRGCVQGRGYSS